MTLGWICANNQWRWSATTGKNKQIYEAACHLATTIWPIQDVVAIRLGKGKQYILAPGFGEATTTYIWTDSKWQDAIQVEQSRNLPIHIGTIIGDKMKTETK